MAIERTFSIIKPDAVAKNQLGKVVSLLEAGGLRVIAQKMLRMTKEQAEGSRQIVTAVDNMNRMTQQVYFATSEDAEAFEAELAHMLVHQIGAFNSPVWFNCGLFQEYRIGGSGGNYWFDPGTRAVQVTPDSYSRPQVSACFIQSAATWLPRLPQPMMPSVLPLSSTPSNSFLTHCPCFIVASACGISRARASRSPNVSSATASEVDIGALTTLILCFFAASRSMLSTPTPARPITFSRVLASITEAVRGANEAGVDAVWPGCDLVPQTSIQNVKAFMA